MFKAAMIGAGDRGMHRYGAWALKNANRDKLKFVAVAEPIEARRNAFGDEHNIPNEHRYRHWDELFQQGQVAEVCFISTQDRQHTEPAVRALEMGYHVLLEKPMATSAKECRQIIEAAGRNQRQLRVAHVLRYTPFFQKLKEIVDSGIIGNVINISHSENIAYWHYAHSYVRGNWRRADIASPIILAKTCHDLDILFWLAGAPAEKVTSFGSLRFYRAENAPQGAPKRCLDGCPAADTCLWYAPRFYLKAEPLLQIGLRSGYSHIRFIAKMALDRPGLIRFLSKMYAPLKMLVDWNNWPASTITDDPSNMQSKQQALKEGPYGRCVFYCDNDVCDNQVVNILFANGVTASMTVHGFASSEGRWVRIEGTNGTLFGKFTGEHQEIIIYDHYRVKRQTMLNKDLDLTGHMGGDDGIMADLVNSLRCASTAQNIKDEDRCAISSGGVLTSGEASLESHLMAFAAEQSRLESRVVCLDEMR